MATVVSCKIDRCSGTVIAGWASHDVGPGAEPHHTEAQQCQRRIRNRAGNALAVPGLPGDPEPQAERDEDGGHEDGRRPTMTSAASMSRMRCRSSLMGAAHAVAGRRD